MANDVKLLPCPFCGKNLVLVVGGSVFVHPKTEGGEPQCVIASCGIHTSDAERIAAWNRRAIPSTVSGETGRRLTDGDGVRVTDEMVQRAARAAFEVASIIAWDAAVSIASDQPESTYVAIVASFRDTMRAALEAALNPGGRDAR